MRYKDQTFSEPEGKHKQQNNERRYLDIMSRFVFSRISSWLFDHFHRARVERDPSLKYRSRIINHGLSQHDPSIALLLPKLFAVKESPLLLRRQNPRETRTHS